MPKKLLVEESIEIPEEVKVAIKSRTVTVKGPRGDLKREFKHVYADIFKKEKNGKPHVAVALWMNRPKQASCLYTVLSHIRNMFKGVMVGYEYRMKFVYAHFPINTSIPDDGSSIQIRNFLGEKRMREVKMYEGVKVARSDQKDEIILQGNNIESVSQSAANIHISTLVKNKDIRKFLDGTYVSEIGTVVKEE